MAHPSGSVAARRSSRFPSMIPADATDTHRRTPYSSPPVHLSWICAEAFVLLMGGVPATRALDASNTKSSSLWPKVTGLYFGTIRMAPRDGWFGRQTPLETIFYGSRTYRTVILATHAPIPCNRLPAPVPQASRPSPRKPPLAHPHQTKKAPAGTGALQSATKRAALTCSSR